MHVEVSKCRTTAGQPGQKLKIKKKWKVTSLTEMWNNSVMLEIPHLDILPSEKNSDTQVTVTWLKVS
jgi:hypothetical protein